MYSWYTDFNVICIHTKQHQFYTINVCSNLECKLYMTIRYRKCLAGLQMSAYFSPRCSQSTHTILPQQSITNIIFVSIIRTLLSVPILTNYRHISWPIGTERTPLYATHIGLIGLISLLIYLYKCYYHLQPIMYVEYSQFRQQVRWL